MKPKLLDLFCGAGGAARGYQLAGFYVVGVDHKPQPHYIGEEFVQADALEYVAAHGSEFDAIHASPPCQAYTGMRRIALSRFGSAPEYPDMIADVRQFLRQTGRPFVIENVAGSPLETQIILCGVALGLPHLARHRHFESNIVLLSTQCAHRRAKYTIGIYGSKPDGRRVSWRRYRLTRIASSIDEAREIMGIDWMDWNEIKEAIPPAYTEFIGKQLLQVIK